MPRYIAFLRAINVGGHTLTMAELRAHFEAMGLGKCDTFIASGNVVFESNRAAKLLQSAIETHLAESLGYEVATFLRTDAEVQAIALHQPFSEERMQSAGALNVAFLKEPLDTALAVRLMALRTDLDDFHVHGREVYWLCQAKQSDSKFSNAVLERVLKIKSTFRGLSTVRKLAGKLPAGRGA